MPLALEIHRGKRKGFFPVFKCVKDGAGLHGWNVETAVCEVIPALLSLL